MNTRDCNPVRIAQKISCFALAAFCLACFAIVPAGAAVKSYQRSASGVTFRLQEGLMKINICRADIVEVKYTVLDSFPAQTSLVINNAWLQAPPSFTVAEVGGNVVITTKKLQITVNKTTSAIAYADAEGNPIVSEASDGGKGMQAATIAGINTYNCTTAFNSPANEGLFGLGCHPLDSLAINYKGRNQDLTIKYLTGAIPVLLSTKGYGLLWDNYSPSTFLGAEAGSTQFKYVCESGKLVDYYFFYGPDFDHIISSYRDATGKAPMYGKWAYGLFQSQDRYKWQKEVLGVKDNYRNNHIPVDVIVQDWYYWEPQPIGSHVMNAERYPNPKDMVDELHKANIHGMISIWPVFGSGTANFDALKASGGLTSVTWDNVVTHTFDTYYDAHSPKAQQMYWQQARDSLVKRYGWDAWWIDQCEPDNGALLDERRKAQFYTGKGIDYFNTYSLVHTNGIYKGWRKDIPGKRAFFLARQAFAGTQRNGATLWSSDITCTFDAFKVQVPQGINACASGIPYWTSDIGGYHYNWSAPDWSTPANRELFTRWFQFGTFCPIFRIHGKGERALFSNNWDASTKATLLHFDKLRYRLMPYIYSLGAKVTQENYTIMRSLAFDFRSDPNVYNLKYEYMFGPAFLVNPITAQLYSAPGATPDVKTSKVYLPNSTWYNFWDAKKTAGNQTIDAAVPLDIMPLYVKAGSIIPFGPFEEYAAERAADTIELRIYPGANGQFTLYEDENDNYNYEKGQFATIRFDWDDAKHQLTIGATKGQFKGMLKQRLFNVVLVREGHGVDMDVTKDVDKTVRYAGKPVSILL